MIQIPKIANTNKNDLAIEFVKWSSLSAEDKFNYDKLTTIIKDKVLKTEVFNIGSIKPGDILIKVNSKISYEISHFDHKCLYYIFSIRPCKEDLLQLNPSETNIEYCHYDEAHNDYLFKESWADFIIRNIISGKMNKTIWKEGFDKKIKLSIENFK